MKIRRCLTILVLLLLVTARLSAAVDTPIEITIDAKENVKPISRFIYGINQFRGVVDGLNGPWSNAAFTRVGGNRFTAYNWTNNASNAGSDYHFQSDDYLVSGDQFMGIQNSPGGANIPTIKTAARHDAGVLLTIPINGYVAADRFPEGDVRTTPDFIHTRFKPEQPRKGSAFNLKPDAAAPVVYEDEFVNWAVRQYPDGQTDADRPVWFSLDNEPGLWSHTHPEIHPDPTSYAELAEKSIAYANAAKDVAPAALIFGPANYGWQGYVQLENAPDRSLGDFQCWYLKQMAAAEKKRGKRLLDVLDVHWYPEATGGGARIQGGGGGNAAAVIMARVQAPRSLWDPKYVEASWITRDSLKGPIALLPRLRDKIDKNYPGTKLAITEYDYGGGSDISGAIAEADVLGIFGREGLFAAAVWPGRDIPFIGAGFEMYRNYDGNNGSFGGTSIQARTSDVEASSVYASLGSENRLIVVAINKTNHVLDAAVHLNNCAWFTRVRVFQLTSAEARPHPGKPLVMTDPAKVHFAMPAMSVSTLEFDPQPPTR